MGDLAKVKQKFTLILSILGLVNILLIAYLLWPGNSASSRQAQEQQLRQQATTLQHEVAPLQGIGEKLGQTRVDIKKFNEQKIPSQFSQISQHLEKLVQENGVSTPQGIRFSQEKDRSNEKDELPDIQRIGIEATVTGEYSKVARFINALEQDRFMFVITQIALNSTESGNAVSLQIKFETYLKQT